jgi:hypothetical protein
MLLLSSCISWCAVAADSIRILTSHLERHGRECDLRSHDRNVALRAARQGLGRERTPLTPDRHDLPEPLTPRGHTGHWPNLPPDQAGTNPPQVVDLASYRVRREAILNGSPASTRSRLDRIDARRSAGQHHNPIFEPRTLRLRLLDCRYARRMVCRLLIVLLAALGSESIHRRGRG